MRAPLGKRCVYAHAVARGGRAHLVAAPVRLSVSRLKESSIASEGSHPCGGLRARLTGGRRAPRQVVPGRCTYQAPCSVEAMFRRLGTWAAVYYDVLFQRFHVRGLRDKSCDDLCDGARGRTFIVTGPTRCACCGVRRFDSPDSLCASCNEAPSLRRAASELVRSGIGTEIAAALARCGAHGALLLLKALPEPRHPCSRARAPRSPSRSASTPPALPRGSRPGLPLRAARQGAR